MSRQNRLMMLGLGVLLMVSGVARGVSAAPAQAITPSYTGQVEAIKIDHCELQPGTCAGSLVLAQAGGREVALAMPGGTELQRGTERVHLEELGIGNYVTVQAMPLPSTTGDPLSFGLDEISGTGDRVGTSAGERPVTLKESSEN